jgi:hypothetical protein
VESNTDSTHTTDLESPRQLQDYTSFNRAERQLAAVTNCRTTEQDNDGGETENYKAGSHARKLALSLSTLAWLAKARCCTDLYPESQTE